MTVPKPPLETYLALLRGVNVGGNNMVAMKDIKTAFEKAGLLDVRTYINSGNVIFRCPPADPRRLEERTGQALAAGCGLACKVVVKTFSEYESIVQSLPESWNDDENWRYYVLFLRNSIDSAAILDQLTPNPEVEEVLYRPGVLLWATLKSGIGRSRIAKMTGGPIYRETTARNLNTTRKLYDLMSATTAAPPSDPPAKRATRESRPKSKRPRP